MQDSLKAMNIATPLGSMLAIASASELYFLDFVDQKDLQQDVERLCYKTKAIVTPGITPPLQKLKSELNAYFLGSFQEFTVPMRLVGSQFQILAWQELIAIPYGQTKSYADQAKAMGNKNAYRAVANANGANCIVIVIPCHRIVKSDGSLGGYSSGGAKRKKWLLDHERRHLGAVG